MSLKGKFNAKEESKEEKNEETKKEEEKKEEKKYYVGHSVKKKQDVVLRNTNEVVTKTAESQNRKAIIPSQSIESLEAKKSAK